MAIVREDLTVDNNGHVVSLPQKLHDPRIDRASPAIRSPLSLQRYLAEYLIPA
jgi:hypothetical protein